MPDQPPSTDATTPRPRRKKKYTAVEYVGTIVADVILLWIVNNMGDWNIPLILDSWADVVVAFNVSLGVSIGVHLILLGYRGAIFAYLGKMLADLISIYVLYQMFIVFPLDFGTIGVAVLNNVVRIGIIIGIGGVIIGLIVRTFQMISRNTLAKEL